jgi:TonB-dependent receptor
VPVKLDSGQIANADGVLQVASQTDAVLVTAERLHGEAEAINIQRTAENIVQVLPSTVIQSLPNTNIADAVGRLPSVSLERDEGEGKYVQIRGTEPRLSNTTINGVNLPSPEGGVRNIKLDIIPAELVDRIEVNKTLSANQDADAIGGSVNLVTKTPGDRPIYSLSGLGGYTPIQGGRSLRTFSGTGDHRFGESKKFGVLLGGTYDWNGRGIDDLEPSPAIGTIGNQNVAYFASEDLRTYRYDRSRYGFAGDMDYAIKPGSTLYLKGLYSDFHDFGDTWVYSPNAGALVAANGPQLTFDNTGSMNYRHYIRRPDQQIFSLLTGGHHDLSSTVITYEFAGSRSHNIGGQDFPSTSFTGPSGITFGQDLSDPYRPKFPVLDGTNIFDPSAYTISSFVIPRQHSTQLNFQGGASLAKRYSANSHYGVFEMGLQIRNGHKTQNEDDQFFDANANLALNQVLGSYSNPSYYDKSYKFGPLSDYNKINQLVLSNLGSFTPNTDQNHIVSDGATYDANERVYAGYLMNSIGFGRFTVQGGVRFEATDATYNANKVTLANGAYVSTTPVNGSSSYLNVLPSVQVQYQLEKNTNLRASYGRGLSRPNFQDIVPSQQVDPNTSPAPSLVVGNPGLKPTTANNYDVLVEHFFQPLGVLQAGFFYKNLSNPIYPTTITLTSGPFAGYLEQQSINGPSGHITGLETAWEQRLSFLPGLLSGFGVAANYSYTTSQVTFPIGFSGGRIDHPALQRQSPNTWNLGMTYDKSRFSMRFSASHNDASIYSYAYQQTADPKDPIIGLKGPLGDQYLYAHTQYDIQGSYRVARGLHVVVSGLNLSNEVFGFYQGSPKYPIQREYYHPTVSLGVRWTSTPE